MANALRESVLRVTVRVRVRVRVRDLVPRSMAYFTS